MSDLDKEYATMVDELLLYDPETDGGQRFSDWEIEFLESNKNRTTFSDKQKNVIQKMWDKAFV